MRLSIDLDYTTLRPQADGGWEWYGEDPWTWLDFPPMDGALEALLYLHAHGQDIHFVTAREEHPVTHQWLHEHGLGFAPLVEGYPEKWTYPADLWLDDSKVVLEGVWRSGQCAVKFDRPNNVTAACSYAVSSWPEFVELIESGPDIRLHQRKRVDQYKWKRAHRGDRA